MADFSNIKAQGVQPGKTREYFFDTLVGEPSVIIAPAHDSNPDFLDERLRLATERAAKVVDEPRRKGPAGPITPEQIKKTIEEDRDYDRRILASTCIKGWGSNPPVDVKGKPVEFSPDEALSFLEALPNYLLDPFRSYASNIFNFVDRPRDPAKADQLGESQPKG